MIILAATKSLCKRCNADMKEKLACEIYKLITAFGLLLVVTILVPFKGIQFQVIFLIIDSYKYQQHASYLNTDKIAQSIPVLKLKE